MVTHNKCLVCQSENVKTFLALKDYFKTQEKFEIWECADCSFLFTHKLADETEIGDYYKSEEYFSHSDKKKGFIASLYQIGRKYMLGKKYRAIKHKTNCEEKTALDIGSGTGHFIQHLKEKGWKVEGIEMDKDAREYSINEFSLNVRDNNALFNEEFEQKDVISLWHVLEHLYNPQKYIERILELLKNDGLLVIALPNANSWDAKHYKKHWGAYDVPRHIWHFTPASFRRLIADYPVEIIKIKKMPLDALYVSMLSEKYKGKSLASIRGIIKGVWSNIMCLGNAEKSSSVIYFLKKK